MNRPLAIALTLAIAIPRAGTAQAGPLSTGLKADYIVIRDYFIRAAEKMPEAKYSFRPSPDVRTFAQQVAHVARDQYNLCAPVIGGARPMNIPREDTVSKKADLVAALRTAFAYCDSAYNTLTDATGAEVVGSGGYRKGRFAMLNWNVWHTWEHYGNIVVYLRMNGLVPPSSEPSR